MSENNIEKFAEAVGLNGIRLSIPCLENPETVYEIFVRPLSISTCVKNVQSLAALYALKEAELGTMALDNPDIVALLLKSATGAPKDILENVSPASFDKLLDAFMKVNADFFDSTVIPFAQKAGLVDQMRNRISSISFSASEDTSA